MEVRQLRYFAAVAQERSFTRAAARLHLSQQSVSAAIRQLERQLGVRLFDRTSQQVKLTAAGRELLDAAPAVFDAVQAAADRAHAAAGQLHGLLRLRYGLDCEAIVEPRLDSFHSRHPDVELAAWPGTDGDNLAALHSREADAVFAWAAIPDGLNSRVVYREQALIAVPDRHPLARLDEVPIQRIAAEPLVMFPRQGAPAVWDFLVGSLRPAPERGEVPILQTAVSGQEVMVKRVLGGEGVCPVSQTLARHLSRPGVLLRPMSPPLFIPLIMAWRGRAPAVLRTLSDHIADPSLGLA